METARYLDFLKPGGIAVINRQQVMPMTVATGAAEYPMDIVEQIKKQGVKVVVCEGVKLAEQAGSAKTINIVLLGALSKHLKLPVERWIETIVGRVPPKTVEMNKKAFELGQKF
jgi:indolepyruvate ferredoxin oxidoreductase beta subunit